VSGWIFAAVSFVVVFAVITVADIFFGYLSMDIAGCGG